MPRRRHIFLKAVVHMPNFSATVWSGRWKCSHRVWPVTAAIRRPALGSSGSVASAGPSAHALPPAIPHPSRQPVHERLGPNLPLRRLLRSTCARGATLHYGKAETLPTVLIPACGPD